VTEIDFIKLEASPEPNEDLLLRVQNTLFELLDVSPSAIQDAVLRGRAATDPLTDSTRLLYYYHRRWRPSRGMSFFYVGCINTPLMALIRYKAELDDAALKSPVCRIALDVVDEFMNWNWIHQQALKQKAVQRNLLNRNRSKFFIALVERDGKHCTYCKSKRKKLVIDHILAVAKGGLTELINLQLLCFRCNSKKSSRAVDNCPLPELMNMS
jgi:hypothetical protein